jgi:phospholipid/cholesterol/gamma-HCH transport system substrate-binding protein
METRAHHLVVGLFVVGLLAAGMAFVRWSVDRGLGGSGQAYTVLFAGSVAGLAPGSNVLFNGIKVGTVDSIRIHEADSRKVEVALRLKAGVPVREASLASLTQVGITGLSAIQISAGDPASPVLQPDAPGIPANIKSKPMMAGSIMDAMPELLGNVNGLFVRLNDLVTSNEKILRQSMEGMKAFTDVLAANKDEIGTTLKNMRATTDSFRTAAAHLNDMITKIDGDLLNGNKSIVNQANKAMVALRSAAEKLDRTIGGNADQLAVVARRSLQEIELLAKDGRRAAQNFDRLLVRVERNPKSLIWGDTSVREYKPN